MRLVLIKPSFEQSGFTMEWSCKAQNKITPFQWHCLWYNTYVCNILHCMYNVHISHIYLLWNWLEVWCIPKVNVLFELFQSVQFVWLHPTKVPADGMLQLRPGRRVSRLLTHPIEHLDQAKENIEKHHPNKISALKEAFFSLTSRSLEGQKTLSFAFCRSPYRLLRGV